MGNGGGRKRQASQAGDSRSPKKGTPEDGRVFASGKQVMDKHEFRNIQKKLKLTNIGVSEALDAELFTVQQWASGIWPIPRSIAKFLYVLLLMKNSELSYNEGYAKGYFEATLLAAEILR